VTSTGVTAVRLVLAQHLIVNVGHFLHGEEACHFLHCGKACHFLHGEDGRKPVDSNHEGNQIHLNPAQPSSFETFLAVAPQDEGRAIAVLPLFPLPVFHGERVAGVARRVRGFERSGLHSESGHFPASINPVVPHFRHSGCM
jgi:hypothetical protein